MSEIRIFHTHIEVYPYEAGEKPGLEKMLSRYDTVRRKYIPVGFFIQNNILYLPRGISTVILQKYFNGIPTPVYKYDEFHRIKKGVGNLPPKSQIQEDAIKFLCSEDNFAYTGRYSQFGLNIGTGNGKTYATICAILKLKVRAIIITHQTKIKNQWIETLKNMTSFPMENFCDIEGTETMDQIMKGKVNAEIYAVNHQTIIAYAKVHGWNSIREFFKKLKVGIKVIDEAHKFFENTLMIDYFSDIQKSFYITATFGRSDNREYRIYKSAYASMVRYGEETQKSEENRRHTIFTIVYFRSRPKFGIIPNLSNNYGFQSYKYIDYELNEENQTLLKVIESVWDEVKHLRGRFLLLSPKTDSVEYLAKEMTKYSGEEFQTIHSKNNAKDNEDRKENAKCISSTIKSVGEGADMVGLRVLINTEPIGSVAAANQLRGRLREYSKEDDTFLFHLVDLSVPETEKFLERIMPTMRNICKEIRSYTINDL